MEKYSSITNLLNKAFSYLLYFNNIRKFRYKDGKTPRDILLENDKSLKLNSNPFISFYPVLLDNFIPFVNFSFPSTGYHVHISDIIK